VDLSQVHGLESVYQRGPSTVGVDTLFRSNGKIPEVFLRGCGVPEDLITFLPSGVTIVEAVMKRVAVMGN